MKRQAIIVPATNTQNLKRDILYVDDKGVILDEEKDELYVRFNGQLAQISGVIDDTVEVVTSEQVQKVVNGELAAYDLEKQLLYASDFRVVEETSDLGLSSTAPIKKESNNNSTEPDFFTFPVSFFSGFINGANENALTFFYCDFSLQEGSAINVQVDVKVGADFITYKFPVKENKAEIKVPFFKNKIEEIRIFLGMKGETKNKKATLSNFKLTTNNNGYVPNLAINSVFVGKPEQGCTVTKDNRLGHFITLEDANFSVKEKSGTPEEYAFKFTHGSEFTTSFWIKTTETTFPNSFNIYNIGTSTESFETMNYDKAENKIIIKSTGFKNNDLKAEIANNLILDGNWHLITVTTKYTGHVFLREVYIDNVLRSIIEYENIELKNDPHGIDIKLCNFGKNYGVSLANIRLFKKHVNEHEADYLYEVPLFPAVRMLNTPVEISETALNQINKRITENRKLIHENKVRIQLIEENGVGISEEDLNPIKDLINKNTQKIEETNSTLQDVKSQFDNYKINIDNEIQSLKEKDQESLLKIQTITSQFNDYKGKTDNEISTLKNNYNVLKNQNDQNVANINKLKEAIKKLATLIPGANTIVAVQNASQLEDMYPGSSGNWEEIIP